MRYTVFFYVMLLATLLFACQQDPSPASPPKNYVADLYVRYLEEEKNLKATATFFEEQDSSKELIPWQPTGKVLFQASSMEEKNIQNGLVRYIKESNDLSFMPPYQFSFDSGEEKVKLQMDPIGLLTLDQAADKQAGIQLKVEGGQLKRSESMVFLFSDANNKAYSHTVEGPQDQGTYRLSAEDIADWPSGDGQLYLIKKQQSTIKTDNWTYQTQVEFYSKTLNLTLQN
jgi:hypothetical protein